MYKVWVRSDRASKRVQEHQELLTIKEAAAVLGVCEMTLRRWDAAGKFRAHRHPINGYRLYRRDELLRLRKQIAGPTPTSAKKTRVRTT